MENRNGRELLLLLLPEFPIFFHSAPPLIVESVIEVRTLSIDLEEAKRRVEGMLVRQGYRAADYWTTKYYDDGEKNPLWSMALIKHENARVLLWQERDHWRATISVQVGKFGVFPVCEGIIERKRDKFMPPAAKMEQKLAEIQNQVYSWGFSPANTYSAQAIARITDWYLKEGMPRKARAVNNAIITGELNASTVAEALSIVQNRYANTRERRMISALIWSEVYR